MFSLTTYMYLFCTHNTSVHNNSVKKNRDRTTGLPTRRYVRVRTRNFLPKKVETKKRKRVSRILFLEHHSSWPFIAKQLMRPTRQLRRRSLNRWPMWTCTPQSLPGFTTAEPYILSVALVLTSRWTGITRQGLLQCPDFPPKSYDFSDTPSFSYFFLSLGKRNSNLKLTKNS